MQKSRYREAAVTCDAEFKTLNASINTLKKNEGFTEYFDFACWCGYVCLHSIVRHCNLSELITAESSDVTHSSCDNIFMKNRKLCYDKMCK